MYTSIKANFKNICLLLILFLEIESLGQSQTRKVLFLGNSYIYTNNLPQIISDLAASTGDVLLYDSHLLGGYTLQNHYNNPTSLNKIVSNSWDYIVLQEQSQTPAFPVPSTFFNGFMSLENFISNQQPCAQINAFMTWGHENGDIQNCPSNPFVCSYLGMNNLIEERYMEVANTFDSEVTPVGVVWKYIKENYPNINLYQSDGSHPSLAGSYLAACCFYTSLFRKDPTLITTNYGLDENTAILIRNATKTIIYDEMVNWYIGKYVPFSHFNFQIGSENNEVNVTTNTSRFYDTLLWDFGDGVTSTTALPSHVYLNDGNYTIKLTATKCFLGQNNLISVFERTVNFCSHTNTILPNDVIICPDQTVELYTQTADAYQWLDDSGNIIPGATNQTLVVSPGSYSVISTINGCAERSPNVVVDTWIPIDGEPCSLDSHNPDVNAKDIEIVLHPNPTQNLLYIDTLESKPIAEISIYCTLGKKIMSYQVATNTINVSSLSNGIYILKATFANDKIFFVKFVKN